MAGAAGVAGGTGSDGGTSPAGGGVASPGGVGGGVLIIGLSNTTRSIVAALDGIRGLLSNVFSDMPEGLDVKAGRRFQMSFLEPEKNEKRGSDAAPAPQANQSFYCYSNLCFFLEAVLTCYYNRYSNPRANSIHATHGLFFPIKVNFLFFRRK
jgi:hypothetical protein